MAVSTMKAEWKSDVKKVWEIVTSLYDYSWRSDIERIEILKPGEKFAEYTKEGYVTEFTITAYEPYSRYEFDMDNGNMKGHWSGIFSNENGRTSIEFTEDVEAKKFFMKPFVKMYLKKQQEQYIRDLKKALGE